jgi:hypothetical protein
MRRGGRRTKHGCVEPKRVHFVERVDEDEKDEKAGIP